MINSLQTKLVFNVDCGIFTLEIVFVDDMSAIFVYDSELRENGMKFNLAYKYWNIPSKIFIVVLWGMTRYSYSNGDYFIWCIYEASTNTRVSEMLPKYFSIKLNSY